MTVQETIDLAKVRYPAITNALGLTMFNAVHREFCAAAQVRNVELTTLLVTGQMEYDYDASVYVKVHEAYYAPSVNKADWKSLIERSYDEYVVFRRGWRISLTPTQPTEYSITSAADESTSKAQIAIWQPSPVTSVDGYPCIKSYWSTGLVLAADDDLPPQIQSEMLYVYGLHYRWLALKQGGNTNDELEAKMKYQAELQANIVQVKDVQTNNEDTEFVPAFVLGLSHVV